MKNMSTKKPKKKKKKETKPKTPSEIKLFGGVVEQARKNDRMRAVLRRFLWRVHMITPVKFM